MKYELRKLQVNHFKMKMLIKIIKSQLEKVL